MASAADCHTRFGGEVSAWASKLCGDPVCCNFDPDAWTAAGHPEPCDLGAWWAKPMVHPETGLRQCEYTEMAWAGGDFFGDLLTGEASDPFATDYWSERYSLAGYLGPCGVVSGSVLEARCPPPGIFAQNAALPTDEQVDELCKNVDIERGPFSQLGFGSDGLWQECEKPLIRMAWAVLRQNLDLVMFAMCLAEHRETGLPTSGERWQACVLDYLSPATPQETVYGWADPWFTPHAPLTFFDRPFVDSQKFEIVLRSDTAYFFGDAVAYASFWQASINIDATTDTWGTQRTMYCDTEQRRACAVLDVASLILHEMAHTCWRTLHLGHGDNQADPVGCDLVTVIENAFRWALWQRYIGLLEPCCAAGSEVPANPLDGYASYFGTSAC